VDGVGCGANVLDAQVGEDDPQELDKLNRDQQRPQPDSWKSSLQHECS